MPKTPETPFAGHKTADHKLGSEITKRQFLIRGGAVLAAVSLIAMGVDDALHTIKTATQNVGEAPDGQPETPPTIDKPEETKEVVEAIRADSHPQTEKTTNGKMAAPAERREEFTLNGHLTDEQQTACSADNAADQESLAGGQRWVVRSKCKMWYCPRFGSNPLNLSRCKRKNFVVATLGKGAIVRGGKTNGAWRRVTAYGFVGWVPRYKLRKKK